MAGALLVSLSGSITTWIDGLQLKMTWVQVLPERGIPAISSGRRGAAAGWEVSGCSASWPSTGGTVPVAPRLTTNSEDRQTPVGPCHDAPGPDVFGRCHRAVSS